MSIIQDGYHDRDFEMLYSCLQLFLPAGSRTYIYIKYHRVCTDFNCVIEFLMVQTSYISTINLTHSSLFTRPRDGLIRKA